MSEQTLSYSGPADGLELMLDWLFTIGEGREKHPKGRVA